MLGHQWLATTILRPNVGAEYKKSATILEENADFFAVSQCGRAV